MRGGRRATASKGKAFFSDAVKKCLVYCVQIKKQWINTLTNCRFDEPEAGSSEDDGSKRKKEFSDLFKKQMNLRKVNHVFSTNLLFARASEATQRSFVWHLSTSVCQLLAA